MKKPEESIKKKQARARAEAHESNCEMLMEEGQGTLYVAQDFKPHFRKVLNALPPEVTEKLMDLKVIFLAVEKSKDGLTRDLPQTLHAHLNPGSVPDMHTHPGGKLLYFSPLLFEEKQSQEQIHFTIAHEIAHAVLDTDDFSPREEGEADKMAEQWGFKRPPTVRDV